MIINKSSCGCGGHRNGILRPDSRQKHLINKKTSFCGCKNCGCNNHRKVDLSPDFRQKHLINKKPVFHKNFNNHGLNNLDHRNRKFDCGCRFKCTPICVPNCNCLLQVSLAGISDTFGFILFRMIGCRLKVDVECSGTKSHIVGVLCNAGTDFIDIRKRNGRVVTVLRDRIDKIEWLDKNCNPCNPKENKKNPCRKFFGDGRKRHKVNNHKGKIA